MNKDLINQYYNKVILHFKNNGRYNAEYDIGHTTILKLIKDVVSNNYDYLLTESYIDYITKSSTTFRDSLTDLCSDDELRQVMCLNNYFFDIYQKYYRYGVDNEKETHNTHLKFLEEDIKLATIKAYEAISYIQSKSKYIYDGEERYILRTTIMSLLSNCVLKNDLNSFNDLIQIVVDDPDFIIDDIELNNFDIYDDEYLIVERVLRIVEAKYKGSIK